MIGEPQYTRILSDAFNSPYRAMSERGEGVSFVRNQSVDWGREFPRSTARPLGLKKAWYEMRFFLSGNRDTKDLHQYGINWWDKNTASSRGSLGAAYSLQFRRAGYYLDVDTDQLDNLIKGLRSQPYSRRQAIDLWCVPEQKLMAILPCWYRSSWQCTPEADGSIALNVTLYSRSCDMYFGYYQAVMQYKMLQLCLCNMLGYKIGNLYTVIENAHVYDNQRERVAELLTRDYGKTGTVTIAKNITCIADMLALEPEDFIVDGYEPNRLPFVSGEPEMVA